MGTLSSGLALGYLSVIVLVPLAAVSVKGAHGGWHHFWQVAWNPESKAALELTLGLALAIVAINAVTGTALAWTLVRDEFPGKRLVNALIDLPFALPTIVAGLTLLALYGPTGGVGQWRDFRSTQCSRWEKRVRAGTSEPARPQVD